jgi:hypothetical protein
MPKAASAPVLSAAGRVMNGYDVAAARYKTGMARFFSPANLDRYRRLASEAIGDTERRHVLDVLAMEMKAFRREATHPPSTERGSRRAPLRAPDNWKTTIDGHGHEHR